MEDKNICIIGMGYVGLTLAVALANAGYRIIGVEREQYIRDAVNSGKAHFLEFGLNEPLSMNVESGNLICQADMPKAGETSVFIITVGTPLAHDGAVNLSSIEDVAKGIAAILQDGDAVLLRSTVKPGVTRDVIKPVLDQANKNYDLAFCPERTLEGCALQELTSLPQVIGGANSRSAKRAARIFSKLSPKIIHVDGIEAAEMVKLVNNTQRDLMFAFANEVAAMCDAVGVNAIKVIKAACEDYPRCKIALPGPVGGPCLEKDPHILAEGLKKVNYTPLISLQGRTLNEQLPRNTIRDISNLLMLVGVENLNDKKITILGLAFKGYPETSDLRGSMAEHILREARQIWPKARYYAYDPIVPTENFSAYDIQSCTNLEEAFEDSSLVIIQNNHKSFGKMPLSTLMAKMSNNAIVYDYWNQFEADAIKSSNAFYCGLGTTNAVAKAINQNNSTTLPGHKKA